MDLTPKQYKLVCNSKQLRDMLIEIININDIKLDLLSYELGVQERLLRRYFENKEQLTTAKFNKLLSILGVETRFMFIKTNVDLTRFKQKRIFQ